MCIYLPSSYCLFVIFLPDSIYFCIEASLSGVYGRGGSGFLRWSSNTLETAVVLIDSVYSPCWRCDSGEGRESEWKWIGSTLCMDVITELALLGNLRRDHNLLANNSIFNFNKINMRKET